MKRQTLWEEVTWTITVELHCLSGEIFDGKNGRVKFNQNVVVTC
jgi:hypothetical protein